MNQAQGDITFLLPASASTQLHAGTSANTATYTVALYTADVRNAGTTGQVRPSTLGIGGASLLA